MTGVPSTDPEEERDSSTRVGREGSLPNEQSETFVRAVRQVILMCICTVL